MKNFRRKFNNAKVMMVYIKRSWVTSIMEAWPFLQIFLEEEVVVIKEVVAIKDVAIKAEE